MGHNITVI